MLEMEHSSLLIIPEHIGRNVSLRGSTRKPYLKNYFRGRDILLQGQLTRAHLKGTMYQITYLRRKTIRSWWNQAQGTAPF